MRRHFVLLIALGTFVLALGVSTAGSTARFAYSEAVTSDGSLAVAFDEGVLKKYESVQYRLDANASALWNVAGGQQVAKAYSPTISSAELAPDAKGRVSSGVTLDIGQSGGPGGICSCGDLVHVVYEDVVLTNLTTGRTYSLESITRDSP